MTKLYNYDFNQTSFLINAVPILAKDAGDDVISFARRTDSASDVMGANGDMMMSNGTDRSGICTFRLLQGSESNAFLSGLLAAQENGIFVPVQIQFADSLTGDLGGGTQGYIQRAPDMVRGVNANSVTWVIVVSNLSLLHVGGNVN